MEEEAANEEELFRALVKRANSYQFHDTSNIPPPQSIKHSKRYTTYIRCTLHNPKSKKGDLWKPENTAYSSYILFNTSEHLPNGVLPTRKAIIESLLHLKEAAATKGQTNTVSPKWLLSKDIGLHWIFCNVYLKHLWSIVVVVENLWSEYIHLKDYPNSKKNKTYWACYNTFLLTINMVPDFTETDNKRLKKQKRCGTVQ